MQRAVLGMTEQFGMMREQLFGILSFLVRLKTLKRMLAATMRLFGLTPPPFLATEDFSVDEFEAQNSGMPRCLLLLG